MKHGGKSGFGERAGRLLDWILEYIDLVIAVAAAFFVLAWEILGTPDLRIVLAATLAVLVALAVAVGRVRHKEEDLSVVRKFVDDQRNDRPYEVQLETARWEIRERGTRSDAIKTQLLRFTRNEVSMMDHWSSGAGSTGECHAYWAAPRAKSDAEIEEDPWTEAPLVYTRKDGSGEKHYFSFEHDRHRGDLIWWRMYKEGKDRFTSANERVRLLTLSPTVKSRLEIYWDPSREPHAIEFLPPGGGPLQGLSPSRVPGGGWSVFVETSGEVGDTAGIRWSW